MIGETRYKLSSANDASKRNRQCVNIYYLNNQKRTIYDQF